MLGHDHAAQRHRHHQLADVVVGPADGLDDETRCRAVKSEATVLFRQLYPEESKVAHRPQCRAIERTFLLALLVIRSQSPLTEAAGDIDQRLLLCADREAQRSRHTSPRLDSRRTNVAITVPSGTGFGGGT